MAVTLTARERRRLLQAHENGYLDATGRDNPAVVKAHGLWCWRLKLPMVWFERQSPHSAFGRLRVDMLTTPHMLTGIGETALRALGADQITPHDAAWERVRLPQLQKLAHAAFRAAIQPQNYRLNGAAVARIDVRSSKTLKAVPRKIASGE
jgi:hypothetical protein